MPNGTSAAIWLALTYEMGASMLLIKTLTFSSSLGRGRLEAPTRLLGPRPDPVRITKSPGETPCVKGIKLAVLTIPAGFKNTPEPLKLGARTATVIPG